MTTVVLADSRFKGAEKDSNFPRSQFRFNVQPGSKIGDHKSFVKKLKGHDVGLLYIIAVGINDIPEDIANKSNKDVDILFTKTITKFMSLCKTIRKKSPKAQIIIATIAPKNLSQSVRKYPTKSTISELEITNHHQLSFEHFVTRLNTYINDFNTIHTGYHLPLHTGLRIHRGHRKCKFRYDKFTDGIHPNKDLKSVWFQKIRNLSQILTQ
ncbi:MAG: hypothetical protein ABW185_28860 [Sedimenticola sp.]